MQGSYRRFIASALWLYKATLSPVLGQRCRFLPTCSAYAAEVLTSHGPVRGGALALRRICRCHPLGGSGYDPPPPHRPGSSARALKCEA